MKTSRRLSALIKNHALSLGFDLVGISPVESHYGEADLFERWLGRGYAGEMSYLDRGLLKRKESGKGSSWCQVGRVLCR